MKTKILIPRSMSFKRAGAEVTILLSIVRILALACLLVAAPATAQVNYAVSGSTAYVASSPGASGAIVIASTYNGYPVTSIGHDAFNGTGLTSVTIPNSVTSIGASAFELCTGLTNVIIGNSVTNIEGFLFWGCSSLASVTIGNSVTSIGHGAVQLCPSLTGVTIPNSVTSIGDQAFDATGLTNVTIPNSVISIGSYGFYGCPSLTNVTIGNSVTSIGSYVFYRCTSLTTVIFGNSVTSIGFSAFLDCTSLTRVTIPNSVTSIGGQAFYNCTSLTNLSVAAANPVYISLDGVLFNKAQTTLIIFPPGRGGSYVIPDSVTSFGSPAFSGCTSLTRVTIPNSITNIGVSAFSGCTSLTNVTIPNSVFGIGNGAFSNCTSLTRVTIPNSVTSIGYEAFMRCTNLTNFTSLGNAPQLIFHPSNSFSGYWFVNVGAGAKAYYYCGTTGWGTNYGGLPTVMLCPPQVAPGSAGMKPGGFGFTLTRLTNQTIVVEASANLVNWQPIWTNTPPGASAEFVDPEWLQQPRRFYRARSD